jgi:hypothetical protein
MCLDVEAPGKELRGRSCGVCNGEKGQEEIRERAVVCGRG